MNYPVLIEKALEARQRSYCPYSGFAVGAALETADGRIFLGCNIENAALTPTSCAERTAFFNAVSRGASGFKAIAVVGGPKDAAELDFCPPCGVCRQVMAEFCLPGDFVVILARSPAVYKVLTLEKLLPMGFSPADMGKTSPADFGE